MNKRVPPGLTRFSAAKTLFEGLDGAAVATLLAVGAEITLVIDNDGTIIDVACDDPSLAPYGFDEMRGKKWQDTVTIECHDKIDALLADSKKHAVTEKRQVNHPAKGLPDLPVTYKLISIEGINARLAIGADMRQIARMQQQLVQVQLDLESEYRRIQEAETRYRTAFQKCRLPSIMVDGGRKTILDANMAASKLLGRPVQKLVGASLSTLFDKENRDRLINALSEVRHSGTTQTILTELADSGNKIEGSIEPYRENGNTNLIIALSEQSEAGQQLPPELDLSSPSIKGIPEPYVIIDEKGVVRSINSQFLDLIGAVNANQVIGRNINNWLGASPIDMQTLVSRVGDDKLIRNFQTFANDDLSNRKPVTVAARQFAAGNQNLIGVLVSETSSRDTRATAPSLEIPGAPSDFGDLVGRVPMKELIREALDVIEKMCIEAALQQTNNNRASAAEILGLSRQSLYIKLRRHGLEDFDATKS
jgi:transcriptional regulator PpsR